MSRPLLTFVFSLVFVAGCGVTGPNKKLEGKALIARSALLKECPSVPITTYAGAYESALTADLAVKAAGFVAEKVVDQVAKAIEEAAEADSAPFIVKGSSPESLYYILEKDPIPMRCLVVAVGAYKVGADACEGKTETWLGKDISCGEGLRTKMQSWGMDVPKFYTEVLLAAPKKGPVGYLQPSIVRLYYPEPISDLGSRNVKDVALAITGSSATAGLDGGKQVFSLGFASSWLRPGIDYTADLTSLVNTFYGLPVPNFGHWFAMPMDIKAVGPAGGVGGPVNIETVFTEVPNPTKWLQALNKFVSENKKKAKDDLKEQLELAVSEEKREARKAEEREAGRTKLETALKSCPVYETAVEKLEIAHAELTAAVPANQAKQMRDFALACLGAQRQYEKTFDAWKGAGQTEDSLCYMAGNGWPSVLKCQRP